MLANYITFRNLKINKCQTGQIMLQFQKGKCMQQIMHEQIKKADQSCNTFIKCTI